MGRPGRQGLVCQEKGQGSIKGRTENLSSCVCRTSGGSQGEGSPWLAMRKRRDGAKGWNPGHRGRSICSVIPCGNPCPCHVGCLHWDIWPVRSCMCVHVPVCVCVLCERLLHMCILQGQQGMWLQACGGVVPHLIPQASAPVSTAPGAAL